MVDRRTMTDSSMQSVAIAGLCLIMSLVSGCDNSARREGLGGGARTPVTVTLLREDGAGDGAGSAGVAAGPKITEFGTVRGTISVDGALPKLPDILSQGAETKDPICSAKAVPNQTVVGENGGLGNVFIYLRKVPNVDIPAPSQTQVEFDQQGCVFVPHAQVVQVGQPVLLKNSDPIAHNVKFEGQANTYANTIPPLSGNVVYSFEFAERKPALVKCDFHTFMAAWLMPIEHPWVAVTKPDGTFEIPNVPAGKMEFVIWHEKLDYIERSLAVDVPANGDAAPIEISVSAAKLGG